MLQVVEDVLPGTPTARASTLFDEDGSHNSSIPRLHDKLLRMALGIILTPNGYVVGGYPSEIASTVGGGRPLGPFDPQYNARGEAGLYYDTPLGGGGLGAAVPNDFQLAQVRGILTPNQGWIATNRGAYNYPWVPPNGWTPTGATNVRIALGDAAVTPESAQSVIAELNAHHRRLFALTAISTAAVFISAIVGAVRTVRLMRQDRLQEQGHGG